MNSIEQDSRDKAPSVADSQQNDVNYYAFFDKPSAENLSANRIGLQSPQQQRALQAHLSSQRTSLVIWNVLLICAVLGMLFLFWQIDASDGVISVRNQLLNAAMLFTLLLVFALWFMGDWFIFFMRDDVESASVQSAVGRVEWSGSRYRMRTDDRLLRTLRSHVAMPPPGEYRFYFLPHSRLVLMAEEAGSNASYIPESFRILAAVNNFSLEDLKLNRRGVLSRYQENTLFWSTWPYLLFCTGSIIFFIIIGQRFFSALSLFRNQLIVLIFAGMFLRFAWSALQLIGDLWHGKVYSVEGPVSRMIHRSRYSDSYYYVSESHKFQVSRAAYDALIEGTPLPGLLCAAQ